MLNSPCLGPVEDRDAKWASSHLKTGKDSPPICALGNASITPFELYGILMEKSIATNPRMEIRSGSGGSDNNFAQEVEIIETPGLPSWEEAHLSSWGAFCGFIVPPMYGYLSPSEFRYGYIDHGMSSEMIHLELMELVCLSYIGVIYPCPTHLCMCVDLMGRARGVEPIGQRPYAELVRMNLDIVEVQREFLLALIESELDQVWESQSVLDELQNMDG